MQPNHSRSSLKICHSYVVQAVSPTAYACPTVRLSVSLLVFLTVLMSVSLSLCASLSVCPSVSLHLKHAFGQGLNQRGPKRSRDSKHERETPPNSGHIFWAALSPASWSSTPLPLLLLLLLLVLVLHSFVYWHFVMCCKWQPRHMNNGTREQCPVCSWLVPLLHAGPFPFWSLWQIADILGHQYLTPARPFGACAKWKTCPTGYPGNHCNWLELHLKLKFKVLGPQLLSAQKLPSNKPMPN